MWLKGLRPSLTNKVSMSDVFSNEQMKMRLPPQDLDAEVATLGAMMLEPSSIATVIPILKSEDFYKIAHQHIYASLLDLYSHGESPDTLVLKDDLQSKGLLETVGGIPYITVLTDAVPSAANIEYYARIVLEASIRRRLIRASSKILEDVYNKSIDSRELLEDAQRKIFELTDAGSAASFKEIKEVVIPFVDHIEKMRRNKDHITGISSGFKALDNLTFGFQNSEFIIVGARPSMGKTAFALSMAANMSIRGGVTSAFFSLEMSEMQLMQRLVALEAKIDSTKMRSGHLSTKDFKKITNTCSKIYDAPMYMVEMPNMKLLDLSAMARQLCTRYGVQIIFIDYLGLISSENYAIPRHEQIAEISRSLKSMARELNIPIVALSQLIRDAEDKRPILSSIRESGSLEQDADLVMFLHRARKETVQDVEKPIDTELIIAKQRNGPIGTVHIDFIPMYTGFVPHIDDAHSEEI